MSIELLSDAAIQRLDLWPLAREAVRRGLIAAARGEAASAPVARIAGPGEGQTVNVKFGAVAAAGQIGGKVGTYWPGNAAKGLPNHAATTLLLDAETGRPRALVSALMLNRWRTAAADALAVSALARPDADRLAVVGAGAQAEFEARAIARERPLSRIFLGARSAAGGRELAQRLQDLGVPIEVRPIAEAVAAADIIACATSARSPVVDLGMVRPGSHISAMGADAPGKQELSADLAGACEAFADLPAQACEVGELQHLARAGRPASEIVALGHVLAGERAGRSGDDAITLFDSSGLAAQDLFVAQAALDAARAAGLVQTLEF